MAYRIIVKPSARKEIERINKPDRLKIIDGITSLSEEPRPSGCKKLVSFKSTYRIRVGDYRIIYTIMDSDLIIEVIKVAHRRESYR